MEQSYTFSDSVIARICQILQEALLLGVDITDIMRQIEVTPTDNGKVELTKHYVTVVAAQHDKLLSDVEKLRDQKK